MWNRFNKADLQATSHVKEYFRSIYIDRGRVCMTLAFDIQDWGSNVDGTKNVYRFIMTPFFEFLSCRPFILDLTPVLCYLSLHPTAPHKFGPCVQVQHKCREIHMLKENLCYNPL
jgi:hypothetical protein